MANLPPELKAMIFSFLPLEDILLYNAKELICSYYKDIKKQFAKLTCECGCIIKHTNMTYDRLDNTVSYANFTKDNFSWRCDNCYIRLFDCKLCFKFLKYIGNNGCCADGEWCTNPPCFCRDRDHKKEKCDTPQLRFFFEPKCNVGYENNYFMKYNDIVFSDKISYWYCEDCIIQYIFKT